MIAVFEIVNIKRLLKALAFIRTAADIGAGIQDIFYSADQLGILERFEESDVSCFEVEKEVLDRIADSGSPQGILAVATVKETDVDSLAQCRRVVVVDAVQDPGNLGLLLGQPLRLGSTPSLPRKEQRTCGARKRFEPALNASFALQSLRNFDLVSGLNALREAGHFVVATDSKGDTELDALPLSEHMALVMGSEAHGLSEVVANRANALVSVPMKPSVESLNVAVAAGLLMYRMR